jgi:hypothetical protein
MKGKPTKDPHRIFVEEGHLIDEALRRAGREAKGSQHQRRPVSFSFSSLERRRPLSGIQGATGSLRSLPR